MEGDNEALEGRRRKPKSLLEPTENMLAAKRELETRKNQIKPEDDPFWEKRGGKGERLYPKYSEVTEKPLKDNHGNVLPLSPSSRLLVPTKAAIRGTYHKEEDATHSRNICPLPTSSHLLTPTKASSMGEYHTSPASPSSIRGASASVSASASQPSQPALAMHSPTLLELTANRRASAWEKKPEPEMDPREEGWKNILLGRKNPGFREVAPVPVARHNEHYKDVKSKLYNPTIASAHQMWVHSASGGGELILDEDGVERDMSHLLLDEGSDHHSAEDQMPRGDSHVSLSHSKYANICSRLYDSTTATKAAMWSNRVASPPPRRQSLTSRPPEVEAKMTKAQLYGKREKFVRVDSKDLQEIEKTHRPRHRHSAGDLQSRSASAPIFGRIFVPVYTPIATRAQLMQRFPRSLSPSPRRASGPPVTHVGVPGGLSFSSDDQPESSAYDEGREESAGSPPPELTTEDLQVENCRPVSSPTATESPPAVLTEE
jgi:hypothetical protein